MLKDEVMDRALHEKIGHMSADIKNIDKKVDTLSDNLSTNNYKLQELITKTVTKDDCGRKEKSLIKRIKNTKLKEEEDKSSSLILSEIKDLLSSSSVVKQKSTLLKRLKDNATAITAILGLIALLGAGMIKFAYFIVDIDTALKKHQKEVQLIKQSAQSKQDRENGNSINKANN